MKNEKRIVALVALGLVGGLASVSHGQVVINQSGATLLENFLKAPAATNDYIDVDSDGNAKILGSSGADQLAEFTYPTFGPQTTSDSWNSGSNIQKSRWWVIQYRVVGSVNGFQELVDFGSTFVTTPDNVQIFSNKASKGFHNRNQYINAQILQGIGNPANPGGAPAVSNTTSLLAEPTASPTAGIRIDMAPVDVPGAWAVFYAGTPSAERSPTQAGYGNNPKVSLANPLNANVLGGESNKLANLGTRNFNVSSPDSNTIFDTAIAFAPIAAITNLGTGMTQIDATDLKHLNLTGRLKSGENIMFTTRDSGSGTRNAFCNSVCVDPSFGYGENIGLLSAGAENILGDQYNPSNKNGNAEVEVTVQNTRIGIGYAGAERGYNSGWLTGGRLEVLAIRNDSQGGTGYFRPTIDAILDNATPESYRIGGPSVFSHLGDPLASGAIYGGSSNGNPKMRNEHAAEYLNNMSQSITAFTGNPGGSTTNFTPGQFLAVNFLLTSGLDALAQGVVPGTGSVDPCTWVANSTLVQAVQDYARANNILKSSGYYTFGTFTLNGINPTRKTNQTYSDGRSTSYVSQGGATLGYGVATLDRNRIGGDFNGDAKRDINDTCELLKAWDDRYNFTPWTAPTGTGAIAGAPGTDACIEILGDFNGDGSFDTADVRYFADGLAVDPATRLLDRKAAFAAIDTCYSCGGLITNFFGTRFANSFKRYAAGDSRGDIAGSGVVTPGFAPTGADGMIDAADIDYVGKQFLRNPDVTDGALNWNVAAEAEDGDLSADMTGDRVIDQSDLDDLVRNILCTEYGDLDLDGDVDASDLGQIQLGGSGWGDGDFDQNGVVDAADVAICTANQGFVTLCCPTDIDNTGFVDTEDFDAFVRAFEAGCLNADFDGTGFTDTDDYDAFVQRFELGC
ncbi:MAG: hypothetical protein GIKADHBN_01481 [Phycisphaerales bacterium]|nr:hypothetical protein [Phycisphaerales bacterium]